MNILGIETTGKIASVMIKRNNMLYTNRDINQITHSEKLLPLIHKTLEQSGITIADIDAFMLTNGPGSFTGCRIGVATIKGLTLAKNTPIMAISSLELIALTTYLKQDSKEKSTICAILDARNNRVYYGIYKLETTLEGTISITTIHSLKNDDISQMLKTLHAKDTYTIAGDCTDKFKEMIESFAIETNANYTVFEEQILPDAFYLAKYDDQVTQSILNSHMTTSFTLDVAYARVSQAERVKNGTD